MKNETGKEMSSKRGIKKEAERRAESRKRNNDRKATKGRQEERARLMAIKKPSAQDTQTDSIGQKWSNASPIGGRGMWILL